MWQKSEQLFVIVTVLRRQYDNCAIAGMFALIGLQRFSYLKGDLGSIHLPL